MKSVTQKHNFGCGAACVSFIVNKPYEDIAAQLGVRAAQNGGYGCQKLCRTLNQHIKDGNYRFRKFKPEIEHLVWQQGTIVFTKRSESHPAGHYLARSGDTWMDPWINLSESEEVSNARSGFRAELPGDIAFIIFLDPESSSG